MQDNPDDDDDLPRDWFETQFQPPGEPPFTLHILTHGRVYTEEHESLDEALDAARSAAGEARETPTAIIDSEGQVVMDAASLNAWLQRP